MNIIFIIMGVFMALAMLLTCEIYFQITENREETTVIAIAGLTIALLIMVVGIFI